MNPNEYETSLEQAEAACFAELAELLELQEGKNATIAISKGQADGMVFMMGGLGSGETMTFPAHAHYFTAGVDLFNRDRATLQRWVMRIVGNYPVNHVYRTDDFVRDDANVIHFRVNPGRESVGKITATTVTGSNTGEVPTWTAHIDFDVVFIADPDYIEPNQTGEHGEPSQGGGETGGESDIPDMPD